MSLQQFNLNIEGKTQTLYNKGAIDYLLENLSGNIIDSFPEYTLELDNTGQLELLKDGQNINTCQIDAINNASGNTDSLGYLNSLRFNQLNGSYTQIPLNKLSNTELASLEVSGLSVFNADAVFKDGIEVTSGITTDSLQVTGHSELATLVANTGAFTIIMSNSGTIGYVNSQTIDTVNLNADNVNVINNLAAVRADIPEIQASLISGLTLPSGDSYAANKQYVDSAISNSSNGTIQNTIAMIRQAINVGTYADRDHPTVDELVAALNI